jgi:hypothetical protein
MLKSFPNRTLFLQLYCRRRLHGRLLSPLQISRLLSLRPAELRHTAALATLWIIWKGTNRKVFDGITLTPRAMSILLSEHLKLWVCRAKRRTGTKPLLYVLVQQLDYVI